MVGIKRQPERGPYLKAKPFGAPGVRPQIEIASRVIATVNIRDRVDAALRLDGWIQLAIQVAMLSRMPLQRTSFGRE